MIKAISDIFLNSDIKSEFWHWSQDSEKKSQNSEIKVTILRLKSEFWDQIRIVEFWDERLHSRILRLKTEF